MSYVIKGLKRDDLEVIGHTGAGNPYLGFSGRNIALTLDDGTAVVAFKFMIVEKTKTAAPKTEPAAPTAAPFNPPKQAKPKQDGVAEMLKKLNDRLDAQQQAILAIVNGK